MVATYILMFARLTILAVFAWAVIGKASNLPAFQEAIVDFRLLPEAWSKVAARVFLGMELIVVLCMITGGSIILFIGFLLAASLLLIFSTALIIVLRRNLRVTCNCFGRTEQRISPYDVARNVLFTLCSVAGCWSLRSPTLDLSGAQILLIGLMALCFALLTTNLTDVAETLRRPFPVH